MFVEKINDVFRFKFKYEPALVEAVKGLPGRKYDPKTKTWTVPASPHSVQDVLKIADSFGLQVDPEVYNLCVDQSVKEELPEDFQIVTRQDIPVWKHQKHMVAYARELPAVLWDCGMGTGKTRSAIDFIQTEGFPYVLVQCPLAVVPAWESQIEQFACVDMVSVALGRNMSVAKKKETAEFNLDLALHRKTPHVFIINYESAWREPFRSWALSIEWPLIILDEAHNIKAPGGKASNFCATMGKKAKNKLALTGTPLPHSPLDAYGLYRALDPAIFGTSFARFKHRYCEMGGYLNKQVKAFQRMGEFQEKLNSLRIHVSRDVLDLPEAVHTDVPCYLNQETAKLYLDLENEFFSLVDAGEVTADNALTRLLRLQQVTSGFIKTDEGTIQPLVSSKSDALRTLLEGLPEDEPVVVFCRFTHDIDKVGEVAESLGRGCLELSGRHKQLELWQMGQAPVLAVQIKAGREGVDMTRARYCVYYSLGFSLSDYEQSLARIHRPGQSNTVFYYHLVTKNTVDTKVYSALKQRKNVIQAILER